MTQTYVNDGASLSGVRRDTVSLQEQANMGAVGNGRFEVDDTDGTLELVGLKAFKAEQSSCSVVTMFRGHNWEREYSGDEQFTGAARRIDVSVVDLNARLGFKVIRGTSWRKRAHETISDRLTDLLASPFLTGLVADNGFVDYPSTMVDGGDLRGQRPADVLADMAERAGFNYFVYWDESADEASLWFQDSNTSTDWTSTLLISSVAGTQDASTTFAPQNPRLRRTPERTVSGVWLPYKNGNVYRTRAATEDTYEPRDGTAPNSNRARRVKAREDADDFLFKHRNEEDTITCTLRLPAAKVNLVRAGQRIQAKFRNFAPEGYDNYSYFRVLERTVTQPMNNDSAYDVGLTLSPQEQGCSVTPTFVQYNQGDATATLAASTWRYTLDAASSPGNLIGVMVITDYGAGTPQFTIPPDGWSSAFINTNILSPAGDRWCSLFYKKSEGETYVDHPSTSTTQSPRYIFFEYAGLTNPVLDSMGAITRQNLGYADIATISYPAGAALVLGLCYMNEGPQSGDELSVSGTGNNLRTPQNSDGSQPDFLGEPSLSISDAFRAPAGTSGSYTGWQVQFTGAAPTLTRGVVFVGDNCA